MKYLFIVQGEGRGHMTQAISLKNTLVRNGHQVNAVIIGKSIRRNIPSFFFEKINTHVYPVDSPNFVADKKNKRIKVISSIFYNLFYIRRYLKSLRKIKQIVKSEKPDAIVNFYDLLGGLFYLFNNPSIPYYCIGHQYLIYHPEFPFPKGHQLDKILLKANTKITSFRADSLLALSFRNMKSYPEKKLFVVAPLLRKSMFSLDVSDKGFIHGYILNEGYAKEIIDWHKKNPDVKGHFFWDKKDAEEETIIHSNLIFHKINDQKFLKYMSQCSGYSTTAGFESVCEAMYLGKPIMMVPTEGHFEQKCNALDASLSGAGIVSDAFDLSKLIEYIPKHNSDNSEFKNWVVIADKLIVNQLSIPEKKTLKTVKNKSVDISALSAS